MTSDQNSPVVEHSAQGAPPSSTQQESLFGGSQNNSHGMGQSKSSRRRRRKRKSRRKVTQASTLKALLNKLQVARTSVPFRPPPQSPRLPSAPNLRPEAPNISTTRVAAHRQAASDGRKSSAIARGQGAASKQRLQQWFVQ